jgi:PiT family inorganic phosphate transporter
MLTTLIIIAAIYMGWSMGANNAANCIGANIGSRHLSMRTGIIIMCIFSFLGAVFFGDHVITTIGKGVIDLDSLGGDKKNVIALTILFSAAFWTTLATYRKFPVSTSHAIVGSVAGGGLALNTVIHWDKISNIAICWIITPITSYILAIIFYLLFRFLFSIRFIRKRRRAIIYFFVYVTSAYLAFMWGANDVANATGILYGTQGFSTVSAASIGAIAIILGVVTWGYRVIDTVGFKIMNLTPVMTIAIGVASAINMHIYTFFGIPVSTSHAAIGAMWGVGFVRGIKTINLQLAKEMVITWALTPLISGIITYVLTIIILFLK